MKIEKLIPGMIVYDCHKEKAGNTSIKTWGVWKICIISVDIETGTVVAKWNNNPARVYGESSWKKWLLEEPLLVSSGFFRNRKATKEEKKAWKEQQAK